MKDSIKIAIVGKGGTGKTVISALLAKLIIQEYDYKLLLIDADPAHPHLSNMVNVNPKKSLESVRMELIKRTINKDSDVDEIIKDIDYDMYDALIENKDFCLFWIGQPEGPGCFCPSNLILKKTIELISQDFEMILIDCEAGLEQVNRLVIENVDIIAIIVDPSIRSIETAVSIRKNSKKFVKNDSLGIILNRAKGSLDKIKNKIKELNFELYGVIPEDEEISKLDLIGMPIIKISDNSTSYEKIKEIFPRMVKLRE
ncbi:MAG: nucleotide-binding protein [Promethearchaeota archaeon]